MGCCANREGEVVQEERSRTFSRRISSKVPELAGQHRRTLNENVVVLLEYSENSNIEGMMQFIPNTQQLGQEELSNLEFSNFTPHTLGSLSLHFLISLSKIDTKQLEPYVITHMSKLMDIIHEGDPNYPNAITFLSNFTRSNNINLKESLLSFNCFALFLPLFASQDREIRLRSAGICNFVYKKNPTAQQSFFLNKGEKALIQLILWEGDAEENLLMLLDYIIDLFYVINI